MRILFVADVFGAPGRRAVEERLPSLRSELHVGFCVVNGENAADGKGITGRIADFSPRSRKAHIDIDPSSINKVIHAASPTACWPPAPTW